MNELLKSMPEVRVHSIYLLVKSNITTVEELIKNQDKVLNIKGIGIKSCYMIDEYLGTNLVYLKQQKEKLNTYDIRIS